MNAHARRDDITVQQIGSETVLQDPRRQQAHVVNGTAAWIWERLDGSRSTDEIGRELAEQYDVPVDVAQRDVAEVVESFRALELLT